MHEKLGVAIAGLLAETGENARAAAIKDGCIALLQRRRTRALLLLEDCRRVASVMGVQQPAAAPLEQSRLQGAQVLLSALAASAAGDADEDAVSDADGVATSEDDTDDEAEPDSN